MCIWNSTSATVECAQAMYSTSATADCAQAMYSTSATAYCAQAMHSSSATADCAQVMYRTIQLNNNNNFIETRLQGTIGKIKKYRWLGQHVG